MADLVEATDANTLVWLVSWNGGALGGTPADWETIAFDDSGWDTPLDEPGDCDQIVYPEEAFDETNLRGLVWLARVSFTLASVPSAAALYCINDDSATYYLNGIVIRSSPAEDPACSTGRPIDVSLLEVGDNVLAVQVTNLDVDEPWASNPTFFGARLVGVSGVAGAYADFAGGGIGTGANDALDIRSWTISRGASHEITGGSQPGAATLVLNNPSDIYNPYNTSGPLYGQLRDGLPIWIGPNSDGTLTGSEPRGLFAGRVTDISLIPDPGATVSPTVEMVCEDFLGWARRIPVRIDYDEGRSHAALRLAALTAAGETHYSLDHEIHTMPLSNADGDLASILDAINSINGTRHLAKPEDDFTDWFTYTTRNRRWRLQGTSDAALNAGSDHVTGTTGWRLSADMVINEQKATVTPVVFTPATFTVWQADNLPFGLTEDRPRTVFVEFDDVVRDPVLDIASTGDAVVSTFTPFATGGKIELSVAAGDTATVTALSVEGRLARRLPSESYVAEDTASQAAPRGVRAGGDIGNEYLGVMASAVGIAEHVVWRYGNPQLRPTLTVENWFPEQFELDLFDIISFTSTQLDMTDRLFEIVGLTHQGNHAATGAKHHVTTYVLQECKVQTATTWFTLDSSLLDGDDHLAY